MRIDIRVSEEDRKLILGVQDAEGDGTVPLLSLGYMCTEAWRWPEEDGRLRGQRNYGRYFNPGRASIVNREYAHEPMPLVKDVRGGPRTGMFYILPHAFY
jgi:phospholipid:diacylglycerol acyltransferase